MEAQAQTQVNGYVKLFKQIKEEVGDAQIAGLLVEQIGKIIRKHNGSTGRSLTC